MSAPPDARTLNPNMNANHNEQAQQPPQEHHSNVRHIPIFVEGRDEPVINKSAEHAPHYAETKPAYQPPPQPHVDRDQYFADDGPVNFHHPPNFTRAFGTPFNRPRQGPQPFVQQKAYPQNAYTRGASPQRAQSPKAPVHEEFVKVPVQHEHSAPKTDPPSSRPQQKQPSPSPQPPPPPQREQTPPRPQPCSNDPITQILSIQTDVLNLMTEVENFKGTKKDKRYIFLDEMLTRNLIKLDNIETEGKENIRLARKEAIRCIQKCIAVLEAKAEGNAALALAVNSPGQPHDVEMNENVEPPEIAAQQATGNGEVEMKEPSNEAKVEPQGEPQRIDVAQASQAEKHLETTAEPEPTPNTQEQKPEVNIENVNTQPPTAETRPEEAKTDEKSDEHNVENKPSPKKKVVKKRDKSKDKKEAAKESDNKDASKDSNKTEMQETDKVEIDDKGDKVQQAMEIDGGASQ